MKKRKKKRWEGEMGRTLYIGIDDDSHFAVNSS